MFVENCNKCQHGLKCPCGNSLHSAACLNIAKEGKPRQTNADKIRAMNDEELAEYIVPMHFDCSEVCKDFGNGCMHNCTHGGGREFILKWLQSEAE